MSRKKTKKADLLQNKSYEDEDTQKLQERK